MRTSGQPWFRKASNAWYVCHQGKQVRLALGKANKAEAHARFAELLGHPTTPNPAVPLAPPLTLSDLIQAFRTHIEPRVKSSTLETYQWVLEHLLAWGGSRQASTLQASDLEAWARQPTWSPSMQRFALTLALSVFHRADRKGLLPNPIRDLQRPQARSRGASILINPELHQRLLSVVSSQFGEFLTMLRETGARPGEVARFEAQFLHWDSACCVLQEHKTAGKTGRVRVIFLTDRALDLCRLKAAQHPEGPLFRTQQDSAWSRPTWMVALARAARTLGLERTPMASGYRHTFATDALAQGVPDAQVAELLGHSGITMLNRHYAHLVARSRTLRDALSRVRVPDSGADEILQPEASVADNFEERLDPGA